jgi:hypothetical protein
MKGHVNMRRVLKLAGPILALRYSRAAQRDEDNGFTFTAAMEWRQAAELSSWITLLANHYWLEWERIMHLPRRLAEPIGVEPVGAISALRQSLPSRVELPAGHDPSDLRAQTVSAFCDLAQEVSDRDLRNAIELRNPEGLCTFAACRWTEHPDRSYRAEFLVRHVMLLTPEQQTSTSSPSVRGRPDRPAALQADRHTRQGRRGYPAH